MKYVFWGTPRFAAIVLEGLLNAGAPPVALVCNPDRPAGRKKVITPPPTKELITSRKAPVAVLQPERLDGAFIGDLKRLKPDLFVVAAYAKIIPKAILDIPRLGTIGTHPSLLPRYRGASPIQSAILNGEQRTGVSIYQMDEKMDHGPIIGAESCSVGGNESYLMLEEKLAKLGAALLAKTMPLLAGGTAGRPAVQDETAATYTKKFGAVDAFVDERDLLAAEGGDARKAAAILQKINAFDPEPGAWTMRNGKRVKLLGAELRNGALRLTRTQNEGEAPKPA